MVNKNKTFNKHHEKWKQYCSIVMLGAGLFLSGITKNKQIYHLSWCNLFIITLKMWVA